MKILSFLWLLNWGFAMENRIINGGLEAVSGSFVQNNICYLQDFSNKNYAACDIDIYNNFCHKQRFIPSNSQLINNPKNTDCLSNIFKDNECYIITSKDKQEYKKCIHINNIKDCLSINAYNNFCPLVISKKYITNGIIFFEDKEGNIYSSCKIDNFNLLQPSFDLIPQDAGKILKKNDDPKQCVQSAVVHNNQCVVTLNNQDIYNVIIDPKLCNQLTSIVNLKSNLMVESPYKIQKRLDPQLKQEIENKYNNGRIILLTFFSIMALSFLSSFIYFLVLLKEKQENSPEKYKYRYSNNDPSGGPNPYKYKSLSDQRIFYGIISITFLISTIVLGLVGGVLRYFES
jgi:hypothetical protein